MKILFIDCTTTAFHGDDIDRKPIGGIQSATARLAILLADAGHTVTVMNALDRTHVSKGVFWRPREEAAPDTQYDAVIVNNEPRLFHLARRQIKAGAKPILWLHNPASLGKFIKKGRIPSLLRYRPIVVFIGEKQKQGARYLPVSRRHVIYHSLPAYFFDAAEQAPPVSRAFFSSQPYRGLTEAIAVWKGYIHPEHPDAEFQVFCGQDDLSAYGCTPMEAHQYNIVPMPKLSRPELAAAIRETRFMLFPGHEDETFCFAAAEATALGRPIVTMGIGALSERVQHGKSGFIAKDAADMAKYANRLLADDQLWLDFHRRALIMREAYRDDAMLTAWQNLLAG